MEKKKAKIDKYFNQLTEVKDDCVEVINELAKKISYCVNQVKRNTETNQKLIYEFVNFELKIIQKLEEFNYEIESILEENPIKEFNIPASEDSNSGPIVTSNCSHSDGGISSISYSSCLESELIEPSNNEISRIELENIRETFKTVSEKLGLNDQNILSMRNFYAKTTTASLEVPSICQNVHYYSNDSDTDQIPEKDINPCSQLNSSNIVVPSVVPSVQNVIEENPVPQKAELDYQEYEETINSNGMSVDTSEESSELNFDISEFENFSPNATSVNKNTAIQKLNNLKQIEPKVSNVDIKPLELPDLSLKLTGDVDTIDSTTQAGGVIRNFSSKKQVKNKKNNSNKSLTYDLKRKPVPIPGTLCVFSHIETPSNFFIQIVDDETTIIDKISEDIAKYAPKEKRYESKSEAQKDINRYGVVYLTEASAWYRMEVLDWIDGSPHEKNVLIRLVDYGHSYTVSCEFLRVLTPEIAAIPMLAIQCHFPLMYPPNSTPANILTEWPQESIEFFSEFLESPPLKIIYSAWVPNLQSLEIDFIQPESMNDDNTVGQILLNTGRAVQILEEYSEDERDLALFLEDVEHSERAENINEAITGYDARDEARICRFTKSDGTCFKGKNCKLEHVPLPKDGFTTDRDLVFREAMYSLVLPKIGDIELVLVTGYRNMCNFFVQFVRNAHAKGNHVVDRDFHQLNETINSPKLVNTYDQFKVAPAIGEIVLAKHWSTQWMRGVVRDFDTNADGDPCKFQVYVVDYGEVIYVGAKDLRKIRPSYLELPFQAVECYIKDYKSKGNYSHRQTKEFFDKHMYLHNFTATIMSSYVPFKIILRSMNGVIDIGESLYKNGYATKRKFDINPSEDCILDLH